MRHLLICAPVLRLIYHSADTLNGVFFFPNAPDMDIVAHFGASKRVKVSNQSLSHLLKLLSTLLESHSRAQCVACDPVWLRHLLKAWNWYCTTPSLTVVEYLKQSWTHYTRRSSLQRRAVKFSSYARQKSHHDSPLISSVWQPGILSYPHFIIRPSHRNCWTVPWVWCYQSHLFSAYWKCPQAVRVTSKIIIWNKGFCRSTLTGLLRAFPFLC